MAINRVVYNGNTLLDITDTTAEESDVAEGKIFYKKDGTQAVGTAASGGGGIDPQFITRPYSAAADIELSCDLDMVGIFAVYNYQSLGKINLPNVTTIYRNAFAGCSGLKTVTGLSALEYIDTNAFEQCSILEDIPLDSGRIWRIGSYAFQYCYKLIPNYIKMQTSGHSGMAEISNGAFQYTGNQAAEPYTIRLKQEGLVNLTIQYNAFGYCRKLQTFIFDTEANPYIMSNVFPGCDNLTDIYVPWSEGDVADAPWGATNATIHYNTQFDSNGDPIT